MTTTIHVRPDFTPEDRKKAEALATALGPEHLDTLRRMAAAAAVARLGVMVIQAEKLAAFLAVGNDAERANAFRLRSYAEVLGGMATEIAAAGGVQ